MSPTHHNLSAAGLAPYVLPILFLALSPGLSASGEPPGKESRPASGERRVVSDRYGDPLPERALKRLGTTRLRQPDRIWQAAFSADGRLVASASTRYGDEGEAVHVWEVGTGKLLARLPLPAESTCKQLAFAPSGKQIAAALQGPAGKQNLSVSLWDLDSGKLSATYLLGEDCGNSWSVLAFSADGTMLAGGCEHLRLLDLEKKQLRWTCAVGADKETREQVFAAVFAPDGHTLVTAEADGAVHWRDPDTGRERCAVPTGGTFALAFAPDGSLLAAGTRQKVRLWEAPPPPQQQSGLKVKERQQLRGPGTLAPSLAFGRDGKTLASVNEDGKACFWDLTTGQVLHETECWATGVVFDQADRPLAVSALSETTCLRLWNLASGEELLGDRGAREAITCLAFAPGGEVLVAGSRDHTLRFWDPASATQKACLDIPADPQPLHFYDTDTPIRLAFDPEGQSLVAVGGRGVCWEVTADKPGWTLHPLRGYPGPILAVNGDRVVVGRYLKPKTVRARPDSMEFVSNDRVELSLWDRASTKKRSRIAQGAAGIMDLSCYEPEFLLGDDGILVGVALERVPKVWDVGRQKLLYEIPSKEIAGRRVEVTTVALAPDARVLAVGWEEAIVLHEVARGQSFARWDVPRVTALAFSADGRRLAAGMAREVRIWDLQTGRELGRLLGHDHYVSALAFSPDGKVLASGSSDTTILLWDLTSLGEPASPCAQSLEPAELEKLWDEMAGSEVTRARQAVWGLAAVPGQAIPFLRAHLRPLLRVRGERLRRLIQDLDSDLFTTRQAAQSELADLGELAEPALRQALKDGPTTEVRRSIESLLEILQGQSSQLRALRAVEVLERIGTPGARQVLDELAEGDPESRLTQEARASLGRLARRPAEKP